MNSHKPLDTSEFKNTIYSDPQRYDDEYWWKTDDMEFWKKILEMAPGKKVLELAAGTARLAIPLIREGAEYTGIEISPEFCKQAEKKLLHHQMDATFIEGDIRELDLNETFDLIFIGFNSFLHLLKDDDAMACLECVKKHMHEDTIFVIDVFVPNPSFLYRPEIRFPVMEYIDSLTDELTKVEEISIYDPDSGINKITWFYNTPSQADDKIYNFTMRMYFPDTMNRLLIDSGLTIQKMTGKHDFSEFKEDSELQIYICKK
jgi:SAM-dependent methyltransferase